MSRQQEKQDKMVENIMENFRWRKCQIAMKALNWSWATLPGTGIPDVSDLRRTARYLIDSAIKSALESKTLRPDESYFSATGGLKATVTKNRNNHINFIQLEFILEEWDDDGD